MEAMDTVNLFQPPVPPGPIVPVHEALRASLIIGLFIATFLACSLAFPLRRIANTTTGFWPILSLISVFGGGVFLATCLLDLLPDARESFRRVEKLQQITYAYPVMETFVAIGFLLVLATEQVIVFIREKHDATDLESLITGHHHVDNERNNTEVIDSYSDHDDAANNQRSLMQSQSTVRVVLLVMALSLHAVFEGLSLGLVGDTNEIMQIFVALLLHKIVLGFSLGVRLIQSALSHTTALLCSIIFAAQIIIGGFGGIAILNFVTHGSPFIAGTVSFAAQATACGTFLYITCFEILPHEFRQRQFRLAKLLSMIAGFTIIASLKALFPNG